MFILTLLKISSILLAIIGLLFGIPLSVAFVCSETQMYLPFIIPMICSFAFAIIVFFSTRKIHFKLTTRTTFLTVAVCWILMSLLGSVPLYFSNCFNSYIDAFFESVSGFTTTGGTVLASVENLPRSINVMRCLTHWIGGMGIVTLTVALLPLLGVGGFQLIKAESTGPEKGKVTAKITTTAKILWLIYAGLTVLQAILLKIAGMDWIDAISHALSTLGSGGFSSKNTSITAYNSVAIEVICTVFMFLAGVNFTIFYYLFTGKIKDVFHNSELKAYFGLILFFVIALTFSIIPVYGSFGKSLRYSSFQVASIMSTTGFANCDYMLWPSVAQFFVFLLFFFGGCSGSTAGGIKIIRWVILWKQINNETKKMLHPHGIFTIRLDNRVGRKDIVFNVAAFVSLYAILVFITTFVGCLGKLDMFSAFSGALSMVANCGPAFNLLGPSCNYGFLPSFVKLWYCFAMLAGRLELYTMLIFFMPSYWKK